MAEALMELQSASDGNTDQEEQALVVSRKASKVHLAVLAGAFLTVFCGLALLGMTLGSRVQPDGTTSSAGGAVLLDEKPAHPQTCTNYPDQYDGYDEDALAAGKPFGALDKGKDRCSFYKTHAHECGNHDDSDFFANEMCCTCGGGSTYQGERSIAPNKASVFISGSAECPDGAKPITTVSGCRAALDLLGWNAWEYNSASSEKDWPKGCYYCKDVGGCGDGVWLNTHSSGREREGTKRLCHQHYDLDKVKILFVGDSDIDYWDTGAAFPGSMNVGVGGYTTKDVIKEVGTWVEELNPEWVVLVCGENDFSEGKRSITQSALQRFKDIASKFIENGARVIYLGTKPEPGTKELHKEYKYYDARIRTWVAEQAKGNELPPIQMIDVFKSFDSEKELYNTDELHMSRLGYKFWNGWVKVAMESKVPCVRWQDGVCVQVPK